MRGVAPGPAHAGDEGQLRRTGRDVARLTALRRVYEQLLPAGLDPDRPTRPTPVVCEATVLFTDLRGFTAFTEQHGDAPDHVLDMLNAHLEAIVPAITWAGGVVEKFLGDGLLATFGARGPCQDDAEAAVRAALGAMAAQEALHRRWPAGRGGALAMGIAAARGRVVLGALGPTTRWELGVLGDPVNVAARLVQCAKPGEVLLEAGVWRGLHGLPAALVSQVAVRGRRQTVPVYRIDAARRARARIAAA